METSERIEEINRFLQFVMMEWPETRPQVIDELARRCSNCILSERYIALEDGICQLCRQFQAAPQHPQARLGSDENELAHVLQDAVGRGPDHYDAVVLFSGGKDSAFLLHRLQSQYPKLRLAALTVDNGFMSQVALANCRQVLDALDKIRQSSQGNEESQAVGIDHFIVRPKPDLYKRAFRYALTHVGSEGCYSTVDRMDGDLTFDIGRNFAARLRAPLLISGLSPEQVERILGFSNFESPREMERKPRTESAGFQLRELYSKEELEKYWWNPSRWPENLQPRVVHPFHAWVYDEDFIPREVVRLGLVEPGQDNPLITNNDTIPVMLAMDSVHLGYSSFEPEFAQLVRQGRADRATWLAIFESIEYQAKRGQFLPSCVADTLRRLELTPEEIGMPGYGASQHRAAGS